MKIGILTLPLHTNYGGILQAWALQTILERRGHEVHVLQKWWPSAWKLGPTWKIPLILLKRLFLRLFIDHNTVIFQERKRTREHSEITKNTYDFIKKYINIYELTDFESLRANDFDAIIVGSDQIWRPKYAKANSNYGTNGLNIVFGGFTEHWNIKRVAYAPSFGVDEWEFNAEETVQCKRLISKFDAVSVRESSGVSLCENYLSVKAELVLDPTLLLHQEDYEAIIDKEKQNSNILTYYILDYTHDKESFIRKIATEKGLDLYSINSKEEIINAPLKDRIKIPVSKWLAGIRDASFVITDSFHACVFCIIFNKPFVCIGNSNRGLTRFKSLLSNFGLENHLLETIDDYDHNCSYEISSSSKTLLEQLRKSSLEYLYKHV